MQLTELRWPDVAAYLERSDLVIVPVGAVEQHSPACPLGTDALLASEIAALVGERADALVGPCVPIGDSISHLGFPGTVSLRPSTLALVICDYVRSLYAHGFRRFLVLGTHWDNHFPLGAAMSELSGELDDMRFVVRDFWEFEAVIELMASEFGERGGHADAADASLMLALRADLVRVEALIAEFPPVNYQVSRNLVRGYMTRDGVIGSDQTKASVEAGHRLLAAIVREYVELVDRLRIG